MRLALSLINMKISASFFSMEIQEAVLSTPPGTQVTWLNQAYELLTFAVRAVV